MYNITKDEIRRIVATLKRSSDKTGTARDAKPAWYWKLYETTLKVFVDAVLERFWPKPK
jgi:hypothetical protein